jgi:hypothetical protein
MLGLALFVDNRGQDLPAGTLLEVTGAELERQRTAMF